VKEIYEPRGACAVLLKVMQASPHRVWSVPEAAEIMDVSRKSVPSTVANALRAGLMFRGKTSSGSMAIGLKPFSDPVRVPEKTSKEISRAKPADGWLTTPDHPRIGKVVPGWVPPKMVCVRLST
jgi:hypothetical protein